MKSEKVKEIKKVLEMFAIDDKEMTLFQSPVPQGESCVKSIKYADILTLINELEETNERLKHLNNSVSIGADLHAESYKQEITELENENRQRKDRINELERENDDYKHRCEIIKGLIDSKRIVEFDVTAPLPPMHNIIY